MNKFFVCLGIQSALLSTSLYAASDFLMFLGRDDGNGYIYLKKKSEKPWKGKTWLQFHKIENKYQLTSADLEPFVVAANECTGGFSGNTKVKKPMKDSMFVIAGLSVKPGVVDSAYTGPEEQLVPGKSIELKFRDKVFKLSASGAWRPERGERLLSGYEIVLTAENKKQIVFKQNKYQTRVGTLKWAGDLDGDGLLDLALNVNYFDGGTGVTLFLSKGAKNGEMVFEAAGVNPEQC